MESRLTALGGGVVGWRDEAKRKKDSGPRQQCGDCWGGELEVEEGIRGINGNGKNTIKKAFVEIVTDFFLPASVETSSSSCALPKARECLCSFSPQRGWSSCDFVSFDCLTESSPFSDDFEQT